MDRSHQPDIKAIIFDFGDVLTAPVDRTKNDAHRAKLAQQLDVSPDGLWPYLFAGEPSRKWMTGLIDWDEFWTEVLAPRGITDPADVDAFADIVFAGTEEINPDMAALLNELRGRYKLAVLSNAGWSSSELEKLIYNDHELPPGIFDIVVTSITAGAVKPDLAIYQYVLSALDVRPEEAVFTDDLQRFIDAAVELGIHARLFTSPDNFRAFLNELGVLP